MALAIAYGPEEAQQGRAPLPFGQSDGNIAAALDGGNSPRYHGPTMPTGMHDIHCFNRPC